MHRRLSVLTPLPGIEIAWHGLCDQRPMKKSMFILILVSLLGFALFSSGCATADGFGKDVEKLGEEIQEATS